MQKHSRLLRSMIVAFLTSLCPIIGHAQDGDLRPVTSKYAIKNATIVQAPGRVIQNGTIIIDNGLIKSVGNNVSIPTDAWVIDADSMFVYAGFISGLSFLGIEKPNEDREDLDDKLTGNPPNAYAGITPENSARKFLKASEKSIKDFRELGFTASHSVPHKGMLAGKGIVILLGGEEPEKMIIKENVSMFSQFSGADGVYPNTVIGVMAKFRDLYQKASQAKDYRARYNSDPNGMERPEADATLEAIYPVVGRQMPVVFKTENIQDIMRAKSLQDELGFQIIYGEVKQSWDAIPAFKASGTPVLLSLDLPEWIEEEDKKEEKDDEEEDKKEEKDDEEEKKNEEEMHLKNRQKEIIKKYYTQAGALSANGVKFGFSTMDVSSKDFKTNLLKIIENGLTEDKALAALTIEPASMLGLSNVMGSIDVGKIANLVVTDTAYFTKDANIRYVFVDGIKYEFEARDKNKKKTNGEATIEAAGIWSYTTETPEGKGEGTITIKGSDGDYSGTMTLSFNKSTNDLKDIVVDGNNISFSVSTNIGEEITIEVSMNVEGDSFEGTLSVAQFGSFPLEGSREPEN